MTCIFASMLDPDFRVSIDNSLGGLDSDIEQQVNSIWDQQVVSDGRLLFDEPIFSVLSFTPREIKVRKLGYRHLFARRRDEQLAEVLSVRPLAVTGLILCNEGVVIGRRGSRVALDQGAWEPVPSGGLNKPDASQQLLAELAEEVGIPKERVNAISPIALVHESTDDVFDIVMQISTNLNAPEILACFDGIKFPEHTELAFVPPSEAISLNTYKQSPCHPMLHMALQCALKAQLEVS